MFCLVQVVDISRAAEVGQVANLGPQEVEVKRRLKKRAKLLPAAQEGDAKAKAKLGKQVGERDCFSCSEEALLKNPLPMRCRFSHNPGSK